MTKVRRQLMPTDELKSRPEHRPSDALGWMKKCSLVNIEPNLKEIQQFAGHVYSQLVREHSDTGAYNPASEGILWYLLAIFSSLALAPFLQFHPLLVAVA